MRICLIGEYVGRPDEAMRKVSFYLAKELSRYHHVLSIDVGSIKSIKCWVNIKKFNPDIIHFIHGPSIKSLILLKILSIYCAGSKTISSAMHPDLTHVSPTIAKLIKPNLILVQSSNSENLFKNLGFKTEFLACGVDPNKFCPRTSIDKAILRTKYGIDADAFIILHIGSIKEGRNVKLMQNFQNNDCKVIVVGAVSTGIEDNLLDQLKDYGCKVFTDYIENIEEIYALSDCYIFPTLPENKSFSIEMPLTVLEALSCNINVICTKFGALPRIFAEGNGLYFAEDCKDIEDILFMIRTTGETIRTRDKIRSYSWNQITEKLENIYLKCRINYNE